MKSDFLLAITQLSAEKNLSREVVLAAVESALASAYRKESFAPNQNISVKIDQQTGRVKVLAEKTVVEKMADWRTEIALAEARCIRTDTNLGDLMMVESTPADAGRIAAQTAKQVILQRLHEAENTAIVDEYTGKSGDIVSGIVQRVEPKQVIIDLGRAEAVMPLNEQVHTERYRAGQRLRVYLVEVAKTVRGPTVILSRSHPNLLRRLFELEVPEVFNGTVEIKSVAREAGARSKVAVSARQAGIDPVGCCVGLRGIRIQNIVTELGGEKIDVVNWSPDPAIFIASALSPAQVARVILNEGDRAATVIIPDRQQSLAIGKEGQNVRLAVKLTGFRIDIKSVSAYETERAAAAPEPEPDTVPQPTALAAAAEQKPRQPPVLVPEIIEPVISSDIVTPTVVAAPVTVSPPEEQGQAVVLPSLDTPKPTAEKGGLRFAEDILPSRAATPVVVDKKKKKGEKSDADGLKLKKKQRRAGEDFGGDEYF